MGPTVARVDEAAELRLGHARLHVLAECSRAFAYVATDYDGLLARIVRCVADLVGDGCNITLLSTDGTELANAANAHRDAALEGVYRSHVAGVGVPARTSTTIAAEVVRTGLPVVASIDPNELVARVEPAMRALAARLDVYSYAVVPIRANQRTLGALSLFRSGAGRDYVADDLTMVQDLADRAGLAIENARLYRELELRVKERTKALAATTADLETFSASVAQDLGAPLRVVNRFSEALAEDAGALLPPAAADHLHRVRRAGARMTTILDSLMLLSRIVADELRRETVDVSGLAAHVVQRFREDHPQRQVMVTIQPGLTCHADRRLVELALTNLVSNAWKFTQHRTDGHIEILGDEHASPTVFRVRDNGVGFAPSLATAVFRPLQRFHAGPAYDGIGIGLSTVQRIVERHGGRVWADAAVNHGATFSFTFGA